MLKCLKVGKVLTGIFALWFPTFTVSLTNELAGLTRKIPLTKCCKVDEVYAVGLDRCRRRDGATKDSIEINTVAIGRSAINDHREMNESEFNITVNMALCKEEYIAVSSHDFIFYDNGAMHSNTDNITFNPGDFCLHQALPFGNLSARYCMEDHLKHMTRLRKCCPDGMSIVNDACQISLEPFTPILNHINGTPASFIPDEAHHLIIQHGVTQHCRYDMFLQQSDFFLLPDGQLYEKNSSKVQSNDSELLKTNEFCIDFKQVDCQNFSTQVAIVCTATEPTQPKSCPTTIAVRDEAQTLSVVPYFMFISAFFLAITFLVYALLPDMRNIHGVPVMCYVVCLAVTYIVYGILQLVNTNITGLCRALAIVVHFFYLSTYAWLNVVCFDIWWTLKKMRPTNGINQAMRQPKLGKTIIFYSAYALLAPLAIVVTGQVLDHLKLPDYIIKPSFNEKSSCWFSDLKSVIVYLYTPVAVSVLLDIALVVMTAVLLDRAGFKLRGGANKENTRYGQRLLIIIGLFVMKITAWIAEFATVLAGNLTGSDVIIYNIMLYVVDSIELVASILTFVIFVCKPSVFEMFKKRYSTCSWGSSLSSSARNSQDIILRDVSSTPGSRRRNNLVFTPSS